MAASNWYQQSTDLDVPSIRICVVGAGAMGGLYAALFAEAGHDVLALDVWQEHVDQINRSGLKVTGASGERTVKGVSASSNPADAANRDLYIVATKGQGVESAAVALSDVLPAEALVLTIQNGLGAAERLGQYLSLNNVLIGVAEGFGASVAGPGVLHHNAMKLVRLGEIEGGMTDRLKNLEKLWQGAGFNVKAFADIQQLIWEKFVCNVALSGPCALFDCSIGELHENSESRDVSRGCLLEAYEVGKREGIDFSFTDPVDYLDKFVALMPASKPSLQQDVAAKRPSEIDAINGMVPVLGKKHGVPTPDNSTVSALVRSLETRNNLRN